jgi:hypothetical protein
MSWDGLVGIVKCKGVKLELEWNWLNLSLLFECPFRKPAQCCLFHQIGRLNGDYIVHRHILLRGSLAGNFPGRILVHLKAIYRVVTLF